MTEHKYAHVYRALAECKIVQWQDYNGNWMDESEAGVLIEIANGSYPPERYRVKPAAITINGVEVPEPVREPLKNGQIYWIVAQTCRELCVDFIWSFNNHDCDRLKRGLIHLTREAAEQHARALILASGGSYD